MTAPSTIDALLLEFRAGLSAIKDEGCYYRLYRCDEQAMKHIAAELLTWNKPWLRAWTEEEVMTLTAVWTAMRPT